MQKINPMLGGLVALFVGYAPAQAAEVHHGVLEGAVQDAAGKPVAGAFVKLRNTEKRLGFMVVSQDGGVFSAKQLPAGSYEAQGVGGDFQSNWSAPVAVPERGSVRLNLSLTDPRAPMLPGAWPRRMPEEQAATLPLPEGPGKEVALKHCVSCHLQERFVGRGSTHANWQETIDDMRREIREAELPGLNDREAEVLLDYLATNWGPMPAPDPNSRLPQTPMQGQARKYRIVQYELENPRAETHDVAVDHQGIGWANQRRGGKVSRLDPVTLAYSEIAPPLTTAKIARPGNLQISADGVMWLPDPNEKRWLSYDIKAEKWTSWPFPSTIRGRANGNSMALHHDGTVWGSGPGAARRLDPVTKEWSTWDTPTWTQTRKNPGGYGMSVAGDGRVWMAMNRVDRMARIDAKTGKVDEFKIPVAGNIYPRRLATDAAGDVWVGLWAAGKLMKIDQHTAEMTMIEPPTPYNGAYSVSVDKKNNLIWVPLHKVDKIARYNPKTQEWVEFPLPQAETDVRRIEVDQTNPNRVWWSSTAYNARIGFVELLD